MKLARLLLFAFALVAGVPLASSLVSSLAAPLGLSSLAARADRIGAADAAFIRRNVLKKSPVAGYRVVVVVGDDTGLNEVSAVALEIPTVEGQPKPSTNSMILPLRKIKPNGNKRYVYADLTFSGDAVGYSYVTVATMLDSAGQPFGASKSSVVEVVESSPDDPDDVGVRSMNITQLDATNFMFKVVLDDASAMVTKVEIDFDDDLNDGLATPSSDILTMSSPTVVRGRSIFANQMLSFSNAAGAVDQVYTVKVTLRDATGQDVASFDEDIVVEGLDVDSLGDPIIALEAAQIEAEAANDLIKTLGGDLNIVLDDIETNQIVLPPHTQIRLSNAVSFIDDWQAE